LCATAHKEARFLYPGLVVLAFAALPGVLGLLRALPRPDLRYSLVGPLLVASAASFFFPGELRPERGDQFRALIEATRPKEATGVLIVGDGIWGAGGYFYIGKQIPWLTCDWPSDYAFQLAMRDPRFTRSITYDNRALNELLAGGFHVVDRIDRATVLAR